MTRRKTKTVKRKGRVSRVRRGAKTHPGFKAVAKKIARRQRVSMKRARASKRAKRINPRLKRVKTRRRK